MSAVLEQYFQYVVVDKISEMISRQFQDIKDDIEARFNEIRRDIAGVRKLESNYADIRIDIESLKNRVSELGQEIYGKMHNDIEKCETSIIGTIRKDIETLLTKKQAPAKKAAAKKTTARKKKTVKS